jgi:hypothetical protein
MFRLHDTKEGATNEKAYAAYPNHRCAGVSRFLSIQKQGVLQPK